MVLQQTTNPEVSMGVHKQGVSSTDTAFAFARELVESGEYPNISAAVSGEMVRARAVRERERVLFEIEVQRRLALPLDAWEPISAEDSFTADARAHLTGQTQVGSGNAI
jgi:antitoxin ParD1/3/4